MFNEVYKIRFFKTNNELFRTLYDVIDKQAYDTYFPNDDTFTKYLTNRKEIIELLEKNYSWIETPDGFEYRDNFKFDVFTNDILFDRHRIIKVGNEYYPEHDSKISNSFFMRHLQLFESLSETEEALNNLKEIINRETAKRNGEEYDANKYKVKEHNPDYHDETLYAEKKAVKTILDYGIICDTVVVKWLNYFNEISRPVDYDNLEREFIDDGNRIIDFFSNGTEAERQKFNGLICDILTTLSVYHPMGEELNQRCLAAFMPSRKSQFGDMFPYFNGHFLTGYPDYLTPMYDNSVYGDGSHHKK